MFYKVFFSTDIGSLECPLSEVHLADSERGHFKLPISVEKKTL